MDIPQLISANCLETLELDSFAATSWNHHFSQNVDFLFPTPNKETGIHHFSRLRCLKIWELIVYKTNGYESSDIEDEVRKRLLLLDGKNFDRINLAFPHLRALVLGFTHPLAASGFAHNLLAARGPYLESLHLSATFKTKEVTPRFKSVSELCLSGDCWQDWLSVFTKDKSEKIEKICLNLGELNSAKEGEMCRAIELVLNPSHLPEPKYIRFKMTIPSGWRGDRQIEEFSFRRLLDKIVSSLRKSKAPSRKYESISFHLDISVVYDEQKGNLARHKVGRLAKVGEELSMGIPLLMFWLEKLTKNVAFSISLKMKKFSDSQIRGHIAKWLRPLVEDSQYSILKRSKGEDALSLVMSSKNWDYCLAGDKWEIDCKECELDLYGWKEEGYVWFS